MAQVTGWHQESKYRELLKNYSLEAVLNFWYDRSILTTTDKNKKLHCFEPHWRDEAFKTPRTIFGEGKDGLTYVYSDYLVEWDYEKSKRSAQQATDAGHEQETAAWVEAYLSAYFDKPVVVEHIVAGVNHSNGYPYRVYGYREI